MIQFDTIPIPPKHYSPDEFCRWVVKTSLKSLVGERIVNHMGIHKWWIMRDFSKGKTTPECYAFFVNIDVNRTPITDKTTAVVFWNPRPFSWGVTEKLFRFIKKTDYPRNGDILQTICLSEHIGYNLLQMTPKALRASDSRHLWNIMQASGWELVAQGETQTSNR